MPALDRTTVKAWTFSRARRNSLTGLCAHNREKRKGKEGQGTVIVPTCADTQSVDPRTGPQIPLQAEAGMRDTSNLHMRHNEGEGKGGGGEREGNGERID